MPNKKVREALKHKDILGAGASKRKSLNKMDTISAVMEEYKRGKLNSGSGKRAKSRKQAIAIALSEARGK